MLYLFLYNAEMDILRRKVYADVRNIILKHNYVCYEIICVYYDVWQYSDHLLLYSLSYVDNFP